MFPTIGSNCRCCGMMENDQCNLIYLQITANQLASALAQATAAATGASSNQSASGAGATPPVNTQALSAALSQVCTH